MQLFLWENLETLKRYGAGKVFALAETVEDARAFACAKYRSEYIALYGEYDLEELEKRVSAFKAELSRHAQVYEFTPVAFLEWGTE